MASPAWRVYYADGTTAEGETAREWDAAPVDGATIVLSRDPVYGRFALHGADYFVRLPDGGPGDLYITEDLGPLLRRHAPWIKHGVLLPREQFQAVLYQANRDPDFPRQSPRRRKTDHARRIITP
jgi:hypothetical protein